MDKETKTKVMVIILAIVCVVLTICLTLVLYRGTPLSDETILKIGEILLQKKQDSNSDPNTCSVLSSNFSKLAV